MSRFDLKAIASDGQTPELLGDLFMVISMLNSVDEVGIFLRDLLTLQEMTMLARRFRIAVMLMQGQSYELIEKRMNVGSSTIGRVSQRLENQGDGFRQALDNLGEKTRLMDQLHQADSLSISNDLLELASRYPLYFWPTELAVELVKKIGETKKRKKASSHRKV